MCIRRWLHCKIVRRAQIKSTAFLMSASSWAQKKCPHARQCVKGT
nr:MAG TPA: hypothetical protein [Caudoviricetes sp.]